MNKPKIILSARNVAAEIRRAGINADICETGGGILTLFVGSDSGNDYTFQIGPFCTMDEDESGGLSIGLYDNDDDAGTEVYSMDDIWRILSDCWHIPEDVRKNPLPAHLETE